MIVQQKLLAATQKRERLLDAYNALHPRFGFNSIDLTDLESAVAEESVRKTDELIRVCRAQAAADFDCPHEARELLLPLMGTGFDAIE